MMQAKDIFRKIYRTFNPVPQSRRAKLWNKTTDEEKRYIYDLDENSIVFDLGGYEGQWTSDIFARYCPTVHIFEPVRSFYEIIAKRFKHNKKIFVYQSGLSNENKKVEINLDANGSSEFAGKGTSAKETVTLLKASEFFSNHAITHIDLMKINIEGGEYDLLEHLIESGFIKNIGNIQVQFHNFVPNAEIRMKNIQEKLTLTHHTTYTVPFVWENWKRNK